MEALTLAQVEQQRVRRHERIRYASERMFPRDTSQQLIETPLLAKRAIGHFFAQKSVGEKKALLRLTQIWGRDPIEILGCVENELLTIPQDLARARKHILRYGDGFPRLLALLGKEYWEDEERLRKPLVQYSALCGETGRNAARHPVAMLPCDLLPERMDGLLDCARVHKGDTPFILRSFDHLRARALEEELLVRPAVREVANILFPYRQKLLVNLPLPILKQESERFVDLIKRLVNDGLGAAAPAVSLYLQQFCSAQPHFPNVFGEPFFEGFNLHWNFMKKALRIYLREEAEERIPQLLASIQYRKPTASDGLHHRVVEELGYKADEVFSVPGFRRLSMSNKKMTGDVVSAHCFGAPTVLYHLARNRSLDCDSPLTRALINHAGADAIQFLPPGLARSAPAMLTQFVEEHATATGTLFRRFRERVLEETERRKDVIAEIESHAGCSDGELLLNLPIEEWETAGIYLAQTFKQGAAGMCKYRRRLQKDLEFRKLCERSVALCELFHLYRYLGPAEDGELDCSVLKANLRTFEGKYRPNAPTFIFACAEDDYNNAFQPFFKLRNLYRSHRGRVHECVSAQALVENFENAAALTRSGRNAQPGLDLGVLCVHSHARFLVLTAVRGSLNVGQHAWVGESEVWYDDHKILRRLAACFRPGADLVVAGCFVGRDGVPGENLLTAFRRAGPHLAVHGMRGSSSLRKVAYRPTTKEYLIDFRCDRQYVMSIPPRSASHQRQSKK